MITCLNACRPHFLIIPAVAFALLLNPAPAACADESNTNPIRESAEVQWLRWLEQPTIPAPNPRPDLRPKGKSGDWQIMIDEVWGPGLPAGIQAYVFEQFMLTLDREFACFSNHDVDLVSLYTPYLAEINTGVSKGRFHAIMNKMCIALQNGHTSFLDTDVYFTDPQPGVPLLYGHRYNNNSHFGACLTTGEFGTFVYDVVDNHPLGLEVGDVIVGYDGRPWSELYPELLAAELPIGGGGWLTSDASFAYGWEVSVGNNWHLFETIDVRKYSNGITQHLPTSLMVDSGVDLSIYCTDQLNNDIARPTAPHWATWGVLNEGDKRIGFIWCDAWTGDVEAAWYQACLEMVNDTDLDGLIIDFRNNMGGNMFLSNDGLSQLFNLSVPTIDWSYRINANDHLQMASKNTSANFVIPGYPGNYFDKPIAVLLGPKAISSGDQVALRMIYHPMVRTFGRPTSATFDSPENYPLNQFAEFYARYSPNESNRVETPGQYLTHLGFPVDQEVWLEPSACRAGIDTVIRTALAWILPAPTPVADMPAPPGSRFTSAAPNPANPRSVFQFQIDRDGPCSLEIIDIAGRMVRSQVWSNLAAGPHQFAWDGRLGTGQRAASGTYLVRLSAPDGMDQTRITLLK